MLDEMKDEFLRIFEEAPENLICKMNYKHCLKQFTKKRPVDPAFDLQMSASPKKHFRNDMSDDENISNGSRVQREKFESERTRGGSSFKKTQPNLQKSSKSRQISGLLSQPQLYRPINPTKSNATHSSSSLISLDEINCSDVRPVSKQPLKSAQVVRQVSCTQTSSELLHSSNKGIKSTVPLKIKPPMPVEKNDSLQHQQQSVGRIEEEPVNYTTCKTSKQRVSHFLKPVLTQNHEVPDIHHVVSEETLDEQQPEAGQMLSTQETEQLINQSSNENLIDALDGEKSDKARSKKSEKIKSKHKKQKKHKQKQLLKSEKLNPSNEHNVQRLQSEISSVRIPLRLTIQKSSAGNYKIKQ